MQQLPPHQFRLLSALAQGVAEPSVENLAAASGLDQALVSAAASELAEIDVVEVREQPYTELQLKELGWAIARGETVLPERRIVQALKELGGSANMKDLGEHAGILEAGIVPGKFAKNLVSMGWANFERGVLSLTEDSAGGDPAQSDEECTLTAVYTNHEGLETGPDTDPRVLSGAEKLKNRKEILSVRERRKRFVTLTDEGRKLAERIAAGEISELREANELTAEMLLDGGWREVQFRPYDVTLAAERIIPGKTHPLSRVIEQARLAFLELGFSEANCPMAESAFWDFDALFQPQDHPAREMQDTFYMKQPAKYALPDSETVERVKRTHEDGGDTGSRGWRYSWSAERAMQVVLRTHMTASSIRAIARNPQAPQKVFSIGRVFRRETVDYKHLPEFTQVDGIVIDEHATLATLLGTLATFYERMGIPQVKFKPAFFPYTEPSVEVHIFYNGGWMEMGGAGIFRPEVTEPFGCSAPVLAWGLGLERLAMAKYGGRAIKDLYQSDLDWLKSVPLER
jgi:phenylalanyl-tRNA synthetase alpha chain